MSEVVETEVNDLPANWIMAKLADLATNPKDDIVDGPFGSNLKASEYTDSGVPIVRLQNIKRNYFLDKKIQYVTQDKAKQLSRHGFKAGDLLITKLGDPLGVACIAPCGMENGVIVADIVRARLSEEKVDIKYISYLVNSPVIIQQFKENTKGTTRPRVNLQFVRNLKLPIAPYHQQKRIVAKIEELFSHIDAGVDGLKKTQRLLKQYRQSVLKAAVTGELTREWREENKEKLEPSSELLKIILEERKRKWEEQQLEDFKLKGKTPKDEKWKKTYPEPLSPENLNIPEGWAVASLDQLTEYITSGSRGWAKYYSDSGSTFIRAQNLKYDYLNLDSIAYVSLPDKAEGMRTRVKQGDILVTITGANVTKTGIVNIDLDEGYVSQHVALCRPVLLDSASYLYTYLISKDGARNRLEEAAYGAGKPGLNLDSLKLLPIALPSVDEQKEIIRLVDQKLSSIERLESEIGAQLVRAERNKQSILMTAFHTQRFANI